MDVCAPRRERGGEILSLCVPTSRSLISSSVSLRCSLPPSLRSFPLLQLSSSTNTTTHREEAATKEDGCAHPWFPFLVEVIFKSPKEEEEAEEAGLGVMVTESRRASRSASFSADAVEEDMAKEGGGGWNRFEGGGARTSGEDTEREGEGGRA